MCNSKVCSLKVSILIYLNFFVLTLGSTIVTLCTDGSRRLTHEDYGFLRQNGVKVNTEKIAQLVGTGTQLESLEFKNGSSLVCHSMYFIMGTVQHSMLAKQMNCNFTKRGVVKNDNKQKTNVRGLYVAGDAARDMQQVIIAAAEGAKAAIAINMEFQEERRNEILREQPENSSLTNVEIH